MIPLTYQQRVMFMDMAILLKGTPTMSVCIACVMYSFGYLYDLIFLSENMFNHILLFFYLFQIFLKHMIENSDLIIISCTDIINFSQERHTKSRSYNLRSNCHTQSYIYIFRPTAGLKKQSRPSKILK